MLPTHMNDNLEYAHIFGVCEQLSLPKWSFVEEKNHEMSVFRGFFLNIF